MYDLNRGWQQTSDLQAVDLPAAAPLDAPLVCLQLNQDWLPLVLGALLQLCHPAQWTGDDTAQQAAVTAATQLALAIGDAEVCPVLEFRLTSGCVLQSSVDGGTTWVDVPGWPTYAPGCYTGATGPAGPPFVGAGGAPPNPQGATTAQQACNIAGYIADTIVKGSLNSFVSSKSAALTQVEAVGGIVALLSGFDPIVDLIIGAAAIGANYVYAQTTSDYTAAIADAGFQSAVQCAIYAAIVADGYVTPGNFAAILTNLAAISYTHADVVTTVHDYVSALGVTGLQMMQVSGTLYVGDCSLCGTWCYEWGTADLGAWSIVSGRGTWSSSTGITSQVSGGVDTIYTYLPISPAAHITQVKLRFSSTHAGGGAERDVKLYLSGSLVGGPFTMPSGTGGVTFDSGAFGPDVVDEVDIIINSSTGSGGNVLTSIELFGIGTNPFGADNCTY